MIDEKWRGRLAAAGQVLADLIYPLPGRCIICDRRWTGPPGRPRGLCAGCHMLLTYRPDTCPACGGAVVQPVGAERTLDHVCPGGPPGGFLHYLGEHRGVLRTAVRRHRRGDDEVTGIFGHLLADSLMRSMHPVTGALLIPVPGSYRRLTARTEALAGNTATELKLPVRSVLSGRHLPSDGESCVSLASTVSLPSGVKRFILIDDIYQRGGRASGAARNLLAHTGLPVGIAAVSVYARARADSTDLPLGQEHNRLNFRAYRR